MASASDENPYRGPWAFEEHDAALFFGREREARDLVDLTIVHSEVLLYSSAGAGKTSLIQAALIPMLRQEEFEVLPPVRLGPAPDLIEPGAAKNIYVLHTLLHWADEAVVRSEPTTMTLVDYLASRRDLSQEPAPPAPLVAIFDQFEELFVRRDQWEQRRGLIEQIGRALEANPRLRVVFAMREEYIASLDPYQALFPDRLRARFRLEGLRREAALKAVIGPSQQAGRSFELRVAQKIVEDLLQIEVLGHEGTKVATGEFVEPVQLQVVCYRLWESALASGGEITMDLLMMSGDVDQALSRFYEETLEAVVRRTGIPQGALRRWFDRVLITPLGTRGIVFRGSGETGGIPNQAVELLQDLHLVKAELRGGAVWYELAHDRFVAPIRGSNRTWLPEHELVEVRQLEERAEEWFRSGRRYGSLLSQAELAAAERWLDTKGMESLPQGDRMFAFLEASRWALERQRLIRQLAITRRLTILVVFLAGAIGVGIILWLVR